jgi:hypothetical protein
MNPVAPLMAAYAAVVHILPFAVIPAIVAGFIWKAVQK